MPTAATTGAVLPLVQDLPCATISGAIVAFGALFGYPLLPHQPWHTGLHPPQDAPISGTLVACDWMGDIRAPRLSQVGRLSAG